MAGVLAAALVAAGIHLAGAPVPPATAAALRAGLDRLPTALRAPPGGLTIELDTDPRPYCQGDGTRAHPEWTGRTFHLHPWAPSRSKRATFRLSRLGRAERARLWTERAIVHAVLARWDDLLHLSDSDAWRRVSFAGHNHYAWAFSREAGMRSRREELLTFAEEALVPAGAVHPGAVAADETLRCRSFARRRVLFALLSKHGLLDGPPPGRGRCPAFDRWADADSLEGIEVLFATASDRRPESFFGHLLLRPVRREGSVVRGPGFATVVEMVAMPTPGESGPVYVLHGLLGAYPLVMMTMTGTSFSWQELEIEQRPVRRFRLALTRDEALRVLERVWTLERIGDARYFFFASNCASALLHLLDGALAPGIAVPSPGWPFASPGGTLDRLSRTRRMLPGRGGRLFSRPLVSMVALPIETTDARGRRALRERRALARSLPRGLRAIGRASLDPDPRVRSRAYDALPEAVRAALAAPHHRRLVYLWLRDTVRIERAAADDALADRLRIRAAAGRLGAPGKKVTGTERRRDRRRIFRREDALAGHAAVIAKLAVPEPDAPVGPPRPFTADEKRRLEKDALTEATFRRLTGVAGDLVAGPLAGASPAGGAMPADDPPPKIGVPRSGVGRITVISGATGDGGGRAVPFVTLESAALGQALGEPLLHGLRTGIGVRLLDGSLTLAPGAGLPEVLASRLTLVSIVTLPRRLPTEVEGPLGALGWDAAATFDYERGRLDPDRATGHLARSLVLGASPDGTRFTLLSLGAEAGVLFGGADGLSPALGPWLSLAHRAPLLAPGIDAVSIEATLHPALRLLPRPAWRMDARVSCALSLELGRLAGWIVLAGPRVDVVWRSRPSGPPLPEATASVVIDLL